MTTQSALHTFLDHSADLRPDHPAVEEAAEGAISYRDLARLSDRLRDRLIHLGVRPGDRVGIYLHKTIDSITAIFGILKTGAAYVPVDPGAPPARNAYILSDCGVKVVIVEEGFAERLRAEMAGLNAEPCFLLLAGAGGGLPLQQALDREQQQDPAPPSETILPAPDDLAYILYTSGSTGKPKGVMLSHRNAVSFVDWCSETFAPEATDRFSSHAPFHFDLSILDIYLPIKHGATLVLIGEELGKDPARLAACIAEKRITSWYSTPSILSLLVQYGKLERYDYAGLRTVHFAGEVFPIKHLRAVKEFFTQARYFNLYGPTETNVCTFYEVPQQIPAERTQPFPIGTVCSHLLGRVVDDQGQDVTAGQEGELCIHGPGVMQGYWNLPEQTARVFLTDDSGRRWYRTGDIVIEEADGNYTFVGRRDRMVKKRGYRVELGEIETCLYRYPAVKEAAVIALQDEGAGVRIKAFLCCATGNQPSLIALKRFCAENLPLYMVPDLFVFREALPKTSSDKTDYQRLKEIA